MASFWCIYCQLWTYFTPFSCVSIVNFEHVIVGWEVKKSYSRIILCLIWIRIKIEFVCNSSTWTEISFDWYLPGSVINYMKYLLRGNLAASNNYNNCGCNLSKWIWNISCFLNLCLSASWIKFQNNPLELFWSL